MSTEQALILERELNNAARRCARAGNQDKAHAYRYAAHLVRQARSAA